jgi:photosystem II stability/assembly factor-like uncharacterized protein
MIKSVDQELWRKKHLTRGVLFQCFTSIVLGFLLLTSCGPAEHQPTSINIPGALLSVRMMDASVGWAESWDPAGSGAYLILRTTDGGSRWKLLVQCFPTEGLGKSGFCPTDFRSATVATVVEPDYARQTQRIFHTSDGGQTWQRSVIAAADLETPALFVDGLHGWAFATDHFPGPDATSSYIGGQIALYRTSDGGITWQRIASGSATSQIWTSSSDAYGAPPFAASARLQFVTPGLGWLMGTSAHPDLSTYTWMSVTDDGGITWRSVNLAFPAEAMAVWRPTFFTEREGVFPVLTFGPAPQNVRGTMLFKTQDGGQTWSSVAVPMDVTNATFLDLQHAVALDIDKKAIVSTSDGGIHWTSVSLQLPFTRLMSADFVTPAVGWMLATNRTNSVLPEHGAPQKGDVFALLHTTDGGKTWQEIAHSVV